MKVTLPCASARQELLPGGALVLAHCDDHTFRVIEVGGAERRTIASADVSTYAWSDDGARLAIGRAGGAVELYDLAGKAAPRRWRADPSRDIDVLAFAGADALVVGPTDRDAQLWSLAGKTPKLRASLSADFGGAAAAAATRDGARLAIATGDTVVRVYDTADARIAHEVRDLDMICFAAAFTDDGALVVGGADHHVTWIDPETGALGVRLAGRDPIRALWPLTGGAVVALHVDPDHAAPPYGVRWDRATKAAHRAIADATVTCAGLVAGVLWLGRLTDRTLELAPADYEGATFVP